MIRVNECCCGCSLRTGSSILLWLTLIGCAYTTITSAVEMRQSEFNFIETPYNAFLKMNPFINLVFAIVGFITAVFGILGIQQNRAKYLTPYLYYRGSELVLDILFVLLAIIAPAGPNSKENAATDILVTPAGPNSMENAATDILVISYIFLLLLQTYFYVVIRSCRETISEEAAGNNATARPGLEAPPFYTKASKSPEYMQ